jgi:hypothetical protein
VKGLGFLPILFDTLQTLPQETPLVDYEKLKIKDFIPITESESKLKRLGGTLGLHIKYRQKKN